MFPTEQVYHCLDCSFWCGRCSEPSMAGKRSVNRLASSDACSVFSRRGAKREGA